MQSPQVDQPSDEKKMFILSSKFSLRLNGQKIEDATLIKEDTAECNAEGGEENNSSIYSNFIKSQMPYSDDRAL